MPIIASAFVAGFFLLSGAPAVSAPASPAVLQLPTVAVTLTSYNAVPSQTDSDPTVTASGLRSNPEVIAARSRDLADTLPFGTVIAIEPNGADNPNCHLNAVDAQIGYRVIGDSMNARFTHRVDVLLDQTQTVTVDGKSVNPSRALGLCTGVTIHVIGYLKLSDVPSTQEALADMVHHSDIAYAN